jgi:hypothetical protein
MRKLLFVSVLALCYHFSHAQVQIGLFTGLSNYQGDLLEKPYKASRFAMGLTAGYEFSERLALRTGLTFAKVAGADSLHDKAYLRQRNLSFQSSIVEFSLRGEYTIFNISNMRWSPYVFGGLALFHFNPYTYDETSQKVFLKPLGTEGQGLSNYPERKPYKLTQVALPFGGGVKYAINENLNIGLEVGFRKLFTDYLDDVSTNYADAFDLFTERGLKSVELAYRGDEVAGGSPIYPAKGDQRGGANQKDWYYFTGLHIYFNLGDPGSGRSMGRGGKKGYGCPSVPL